jgi:hypothetical protein
LRKRTRSDLHWPAFPRIRPSSERPAADKGARGVGAAEKNLPLLKDFSQRTLGGEDRSGT